MKQIFCFFKLYFLACFLILIVDATATKLYAKDPPNTITFDNQAGEYALVKLIGPTLKAVDVPDGQKRTVNVASGEYYILTRYGTKPEAYKYTKGKTFKIVQTATEYSKTTITLYPVVGGNYPTRPISSEEFNKIDAKEINWDAVAAGSEGVYIDKARTAAEKGNHVAQLILGLSYASGKGVQKNYRKAEKWLHKSADQGNQKAMINLITLYDKAEDLPNSKIKALKWILIAAEKGLPFAQYKLGYNYEKGIDLKQNFTEAAKWYRSAAEQGNATAQVDLAFMYLDGKGVVKSPKETVKWFRKAADQGDANGQYNLGICYFQGVGVSPNKTESEKLFRKAAKQGHKQAQQNLNTIQRQR